MEEKNSVDNSLFEEYWAKMEAEEFQASSFKGLMEEASNKNYEEDYDLKYNPRGFVFYPSNRSSYYALKTLSPELAIQYLEALIDYGNIRKPLPPNALIKALLAGTIQTIEKSYREYQKKVEKTEKEERKKFLDEYFKSKGDI